MLDVYVFNVGEGQCIFLYPYENNGEYCTLIDCGDTLTFRPVDVIKQLLPKNNEGRPVLKSLILTNYDEDHFSGICDLNNKTKIQTINFSHNLTCNEIEGCKEQSTIALRSMLDLKKLYTADIIDWNPPYTKRCFALNKSDIQDPISGKWDTNNLSQLVFITHNGYTMCFPGDLEQKGWKTMLDKYPEVKQLLQQTKLFIASHHGRDDGYVEEVFNYCSPDCIIISDGPIQYGTQDHMAAKYANHIKGNGILFDGTLRKVLTTRCDGHILVRIDNLGNSTFYKTDF